MRFNLVFPIVVMVAISWCYSDYSQRFNPSKRVVYSQNEDLSFTPLLDTKLPDAQKQKILQKFGIELDDINNEEGVNEDIRLNSNTTKDAVYIEDKALTLKAIVIDAQRFALFQVEHLKLKKTEIQKVYNEENIFGYKLKITDANELTLHRNSETIEMKMYQTSGAGITNEK